MISRESLLETVSEETREVVIEMLVNELQVLVEAATKLFNVEEYLLEVLFYNGQDPSQLYISKPSNDIVCDSVVLITD